jgi:hypothetical protein
LSIDQWVTLEEDMLLHGTYGGPEGKLVPAGALVLWGDYNIKVERPQSKAAPHGEETIVIHYQSDTPAFVNPDGLMPLR